jgi:hypothetical protein
MNVPRIALLCALALPLLGTACDNVTCNTVKAPASAACMPDLIEANREVSIELREGCGLNCARFPACKATLQAGVVVLDLHQDQCDDVAPNQCDGQQCLQRIVPCTLPALSAGTYTLRAPGLPDQIVHVGSGGAAACHLANPDGGV